MDKFSRRESFLLGYSPPRSLINHTSSPKTPYIDADDVDFNDVFGGPPRRSSTHDVGHNFSETLESTFSGDSEAPRFRNPWSGLIEKPVFGEEIENRKRYHSDDFFDDIFRNDDSVSSMPRKNGWDPFASSPGSRVLSPVRPLPPKSSLPQQFSPSPKSAKGMDLPTFGSATISLYNNKDGASNGISYSHSPNTSLSRFSSQRQQSRNDVLTSHHQSPLYHEFSLSSEGSSNVTYSGKTGTGGNLKEDSNSREVTINSNQFHFSIYKWASKGVPLLMPLGGANCSRLKQKGKFERCLSTKGRIESESITAELPMRTPGNSDFSSTANMAANTKSFSIQHAEQESNSLLVTRERLEPCQIVDEAAFPVLESETPSGLQGNNEKTRKAGKEKIMVSKKSSANADVGKNVKKLDGKTTSFNNAKENKAILQGSPMDSRDKLERNRVKGKVKEFVNMFNQEASSKQKLDVDSRNQSSRWKKRGTFRPENGASVSKSRTSEKIHMPDVNKINLADTSITADEDLKQSQKQQSNMVNHILGDIFLEQKDTSGSVGASISEGFKATVGATDESFLLYDSLVKELPQDENKLPPMGKDPEDMEVANAKIQHWSKGKEGNIRSLLSTLQYVLWPESGWKPVHLPDIIEGDAVKRAYQKTLLCLHPDKLQQKGASLHQKFIAEKVFDILQEAWIDFNTHSSL